MANYCEMDRAILEAEQKKLQAEYGKYQKMDLKLDMSRGKPSPTQMDLSLDMLTVSAYKDNTGVDARNYGNLEGLPEARAYFAQLQQVKPEEVIVGGNSSLQLMYMMINMAWEKGMADSKTAWKRCETIKFLCPVPGYDRHFRITEEFGFELISVPMLPTGPDMDEVEKWVKDPSVKGIWCVPKYSNPDGYTYSDDTVKRLANMQTAAPDFTIFWDNAYFVHHLGKKHDEVLNILDECRAAGNENRPLLFCSTSKITFAGSGVCAMAASPENIKAITAYLFPMTIGFDKINQLRHVRFLEQEGGIELFMTKHAAIIAPKFSKLIEILHKNFDDCGPIACWTEPNGGYFISFYTLDGCAKRTVELCKQAGVVLTGAGAAYPYGIDPTDHHIRIAPTFPPIEELETAAELLSICAKLSTVEKLLEA